MDINAYMEQGIKMISSTATQFYLKNPPGRRFITKFVSSLRKSAKIRDGHEKKGIHVPPFLIASIASQCNLHCAGCYARAGGSCGGTVTETEMGTQDWNRVFCEADGLGVSFILLAGGEPLLRRDIIEIAADFKNIAFPIFTNATLIDEAYIELFDQYRNLIPVLSIEGDSAETDLRRGPGISAKIERVMELLRQKNILFGTSITVTNQNINAVISKGFVSALREKGCGIVFYVEYVPVEEGTQNLILSDSDLTVLAENISGLRREFKGITLISFPGDEKYMGGCLAAGRGFFHINASGSAEPCPFSPYSELNLKTHSIIEVIQSDFFKKVRDIGEHEADNHQGGCSLFQHKSDVEESLGN